MKGSRIGLGILLVILGLKNIVYPHPYPPVGMGQDIGYYGMAAGMIVAGFWLIFRGRRTKAQEPTVDETQQLSNSDFADRRRSHGPGLDNKGG
jgi:hypothetical protein